MTYLITIGVLVALLLGFVAVDHLAHHFAQRHPEFGPPRKLGCGGCVNHCAGHCKNDRDDSC
jgi:hypothetical protein